MCMHNSVYSPLFVTTIEFLHNNMIYALAVCPHGWGGERGVLQISSDRDDRMGTKIKTQKNPSGPKMNLHKIPCQISEP